MSLAHSSPTASRQAPSPPPAARRPSRFPVRQYHLVAALRNNPTRAQLSSVSLYQLRPQLARHHLPPFPSQQDNAVFSPFLFVILTIKSSENVNQSSENAYFKIHIVPFYTHFFSLPTLPNSAVFHPPECPSISAYVIAVSCSIITFIISRWILRLNIYIYKTVFHSILIY